MKFKVVHQRFLTVLAQIVVLDLRTLGCPLEVKQRCDTVIRHLDPTLPCCHDSLYEWLVVSLVQNELVAFSQILLLLLTNLVVLFVDLFALVADLDHISVQLTPLPVMGWLLLSCAITVCVLIRLVLQVGLGGLAEPFETTQLFLSVEFVVVHLLWWKLFFFFYWHLDYDFFGLFFAFHWVTVGQRRFSKSLLGLFIVGRGATLSVLSKVEWVEHCARHV